MKQPKIQHINLKGPSRVTSGVSVVSNLEQGIHLLALSEGGALRPNLASDFVGKKLQQIFAEASQGLKENEMPLQEARRLHRMQELILAGFENVSAEFPGVIAKESAASGSLVSCTGVWLENWFAVLAHVGRCRAYLYRSGSVFTLTKEHVSEKDPKILAKAFGGGLPIPDLIKVEFQPGDILFLATPGAYETLQKAGISKLVQSMLEGGDLGAILSQCAYTSGEDAGLLQISFPQNPSGTVISASERIALIQKTPLSRYMDYTQQSHVAALCQIEEFEPGSMVVQEGSVGGSMYLVAQGTLEVIVKGQFITYKRPGEFLGEVSLIQEGDRTATVIAKDRVTLLTLQRSDLRAAFKKDVELEKNFYRGMLDMVLARVIEQGREIARMKSV